MSLVRKQDQAVAGNPSEHNLDVKSETKPLSPQTVAVLPLHNQSPDPEQDYFCDGITDDIIHALSRIHGLSVIGHTTVFAMKGAVQDTRAVGTKLGAGTVVDGTDRKSGNRLKILAEMLDATTGEVQWSQTYERPIDDVFAVQAEIAEAVARVLQMTLAPPISRGLVRSAPTMDAYLLYLRGRHAWNLMSADGFRTAAKIFEYVTSSFPSYASAFVGLADAYTSLAVWGCLRPREAFPKAIQAAQHALRLDPSLPNAYSSLAAATAFYEWRWEEAAAYARTAAELEPRIRTDSIFTVAAYWHRETRMTPASASSGPLTWTLFPSKRIVRSDGCCILSAGAAKRNNGCKLR